MKWLFLVLFIGCGVNALGLSSDDNEDELDENETFYSNVTSAEKPQTSKEERLKVGSCYGSISSFIFDICIFR